MRKMFRALTLITALGLTAAAYGQVSSSSDAPEINESIIKTTTTNIVAPTIVTDRSGNLVDGLQPAQFHLFDNGKEQNIQVDLTFEPISVVVAIEASSRVDALMPQLKHLGTLLPLVVGDHGEAAIMAFDSRLRIMQDFTPDSDKLKAAIEKINAGNSSSRMIDAVDRAVFMLRKRPANNRRIILLISETRDMASEGKLKDALIDAQLSNIIVYTVDISQIAVRLTEKADPGRPDPIDITAHPTVMGQPPTPTTMVQSSNSAKAQFVPVLKEIYTDTKRIFVDNPSEVLAKGTGGDQFSFLKQRGLEDAMQRISQQIRSQYLISYNPSNNREPGFHEIAVTIDRTSQYIAKTRPGYWLGGGSNQ
jgi:VWFA-related protein